MWFEGHPSPLPGDAIHEEPLTLATRQALIAHLKRLPGPHAAVIICYYLKGQSPRTISQYLGLEIAVFYRLRHEGLRLLKKMQD